MSFPLLSHTNNPDKEINKDQTKNPYLIIEMNKVERVRRLLSR